MLRYLALYLQSAGCQFWSIVKPIETASDFRSWELRLRVHVDVIVVVAAIMTTLSCTLAQQ